MPNPENYTVGWICAISTEYVAARAFLDEKHDGPEYVSPNDNNDYTLGTFGKHNVVIAVLPDGEYGTASAAIVARDMLHSFPNVRIGLMVGIGGGAPSIKHDIRLGDVVVSTPRDGVGGVFQYDFGKTIQNQSFHYTQFLDQPPIVLRTAVNGLKAQYIEDGHQLEDTISTILDEKSRLRQAYKRPDPSTDRLYKSEVVHLVDGESCAASCSDDPSSLLPRTDRTQNDNPAIHYGTIASANQLMKDAVIRDKLAAEKDVLCFEMEAAGLMNHFPCLVIRGICDYSDSHKNKEWQGYAAMAAAAYAKDLLYRIVPHRVETEKKILDLLPGMLDTVSRTEVNVEGMKSILHGTEDLGILDWLTPTNYGPQQSDYIGRRQEGTGEWLLESAAFKEWVETKKKTLFCPGIPGAGKTIITSIVVDNLMTKFENDSSTRIAYIYCNFQRGDQQKIDDLLASLLKQLAEAYPPLPEPVKSLYHCHKAKRTRPSLEHISTTLHSVTAKYSRVFIIVDALDECQSEVCRARLLSVLFNLQESHGINIFATSRYVPEIVDQFQGSSVSLEIRASRQDVERYLENHMNQLRPFVQQNQELQKDIKIYITEAADGMFLLVQIFIGLLDDKMTPNDVRSALRAFGKQDPETGEDQKLQILAKAYEQTIDRINGQKKGQKELATKVLSWIICAKRQLTILELRHALAIKVGKAELDQEDMPCINDMVSVCAGLVVVDEESGIVRLVHYTTQEYFERMHKRLFPDAETDITKSCITYLSFSVFDSGFCQTNDEFGKRLRSNQLYDYVARNWGHHAREASAVVEQLILSFLKSQNKISASSQAMLASRYYYNGYSQGVPKNITGLHFTAYFGLKKILILLLNDGDCPDLKDSYGCTPLTWATKQGHESIVDLLLATPDVDADSTDDNGRTPLSWAAEEGHKSVVKLLLDKKGVDPNSKDVKGGQTPLSWAARNGYEEVVKLLLGTKSIDPDSKEVRYGQTPLSLAAERGHEAIVKLLLASEKVDPNARNHDGQTPLWLAIQNEHEAVVKLLLADSRIEPNVKNKDGWLPLWYTLQNGQEAVVKLLLASEKIDPNAKNEAGQTPLLWAADGGHEAIVKLLLMHGANVEAEVGQTPLWQAADRGHEAIAKLLLTYGANVEAKDHLGLTPLRQAADRGHEAIVKLLLKYGANVEAKDHLGLTPLRQAANRGHEAVVKLLLTYGANVDTQDVYSRTPLWYAANGGLWYAADEGHEAIVKLLLMHGANVNARDNYGRTPLQQAADRGHEAIVKLLLMHGANVEAEGGQTPLWLAADRGHEAIVKLLLMHGANVEAKGGLTPLRQAANRGHEAVVKLLEKGSNHKNK